MDEWRVESEDRVRKALSYVRVKGRNDGKGGLWAMSERRKYTLRGKRASGMEKGDRDTKRAHMCEKELRDGSQPLAAWGEGRGGST